MPLEPRERDIPRIPGALRFYMIASVITGVLLLALCAEMLIKYYGGYELEMGGAFGFLAFVQEGTVEAVNISMAILIVHGWFYVVYLFSGFRVWNMMRWGLPTLLLIALGGIIPFLSFFLEGRIARRVHTYLSGREDAATADPNAQNIEVESSH